MLVFKVRVEVMFIYNVNNNIKNGVLGIVLLFLNGFLIVIIVAEIEIGIVVNRVIWFVYNKKKSIKVIGIRT